MKEAAGEANMTIVTIVLIAIVLVAGGFIVKNVMQSSKRQSCCTAAGGTWKNGTCNDGGTAYTSCVSGNDVNVKIEDNK